MASNFERPTLVAIIDRVWTAIVGAVPGLAEWFRRSPEYGIARAVAGESHSLHGHASWAVDQAFVQFAEEASLLRRGDERGVPRNAAAASGGDVIVTGAGGDLLDGTQFKRLADDWTYHVVGDHLGLINGDPVTIEAIPGHEGADGDLPEGEALSFVSSVSGFDSTVTVATGGLTGGADLEDLEDYRERLHDHMRTPVLGGAPGDHRRWALEVAGVSRAWEYRGVDGIGNPALGRVAIAVMMTDGSGEAVPDAGEREAVRAHVQSKSTAYVIVIPLVGVPINYTVSVIPNTAVVRAAVETEVTDMIFRDAEPGVNLSLSRLDEAISFAAGETSHDLTSPIATVEIGFEEIAIPGTATFQDP